MREARRESNIVLLFAVTYFASYVTRINYGAVISEMIRATGYSKPLLSMAVTGSFVTYGVGQLISGACGDCFSPKKLVAFGLLVSSLMNILISLCVVVFFGIGGLSAAAMMVLSGKQALLSVLFAAVLTGSMHGVNLMLISMIPPRFQQLGNVSLVSGVLSSCTYEGSAISTYGVAVVSEVHGWSITLLMWILMAGLGAAACAVGLPAWNRNMERGQNDSQ
ncbi:MAG: hypothetical protein E7445_03440 [Ruminococcaceae bacterium]|nr:hypothetical protein [Oscillospiraceae bacterium]